jgi:hypothetical protein
MVAAACGGGSERLSAAAYAREASEACGRANRAVARIDVPSLSQTRRAARVLARIVVVERAAVDDLRGLRPPEHLADTTQKWIALLDQGADELELMGLRLHDGHEAEAAGYGAKATTLLDRARDLVAPLRVSSCRGPVLPTV